jgi:hypothetical protein
MSPFSNWLSVKTTEHRSSAFNYSLDAAHSVCQQIRHLVFLLAEVLHSYTYCGNTSESLVIISVFDSIINNTKYHSKKLKE